MEHHFTVQGRKITATTEQIERALKGVRPEKVRVHGVVVGKKAYPVTQALAEAFGLNRGDVDSYVAQRVLRRLGFKIVSKPQGRRMSSTREKMEAALPERRKEIGAVEDEVIELPTVNLGWSQWERWQELAEHGVALLDMPMEQRGVYEA